MKKSMFPKAMNNKNILLLTLVLLFAPHISGAQKGTDKLKQKEREIEEKIRNTKELIGNVKGGQRLTIAELAILNQQISSREELITNISSQVRRLNQQMEENRSVITAMQQDIERMKKQYSRLVFYAYKHRNTYHNILFVFAAKDLGIAYKRVKYLKQYTDNRRKQADLIQEASQELERKNAELGEQRQEKEVLVESQEKEKENYLKDKETQQKNLESLQKEEKKLKAQLTEQEEKKKQIARQIQKALQEEIRKQQEEERKRKEAEEKKRNAEKNNGKNNTNTTPKNGNTDKKNDPPTNTNNGKRYDVDTPDGDVESANFENNKGKLPWPVEKGSVLEYFGQNEHPTIKGAVTNNNGIDIGTTPNARVRAVFEGKVTSVLVIDGAGKIVISSHGLYRTVYANLAEVSVTKGQKVATRQDIGQVLPPSGSVSEAHFEVWKISETGMAKQDPLLWLMKK
jgi:septal ring factor EnvC (AmiA/AmiB activator)